MKKFRLESGHVITVDEADAYILRSMVWTARKSSAGGLMVVRCGSGAGTRPPLLSHYLISSDSACVVHVNGDSMDFRRENLRSCSRSEAQIHVAALMRKARLG